VELLLKLIVNCIVLLGRHYDVGLTATNQINNHEQLRKVLCTVHCGLRPCMLACICADYALLP
jgi:hypothetical protein